MYEYSCDCDGLFVKVSSPDSMTRSSKPGIGTEFSWLWRPMPQIGRLVAGLDVERDDDAGLARLVGTDDGRPGVAGPVDPVDALLVREQELAVEALGRRGEVARAEALVVVVAGDDQRAAQHAGALPVERELADLGVVEVVLRVELGRRGRRVRERDPRGLVVDVDVGHAVVADLDRDPVGHRLEDIAVVTGGLADRDERRDRDPGTDRGHHRGLARLRAASGGRDGSDPAPSAAIDDQGGELKPTTAGHEPWAEHRDLLECSGGAFGGVRYGPAIGRSRQVNTASRGRPVVRTVTVRPAWPPRSAARGRASRVAATRARGPGRGTRAGRTARRPAP